MTILALTAAWLSSLGIPVQAPPVITVPESAIPSFCGVSVQAVGCYRSDGVIVMGMRPDSTLLHELAHAASAQAGITLETHEQRAWEEAGAASLEDDLAWPWGRQVAPGADLEIGQAYMPQTAWLRGISAAACRCSASSRLARRWRWAWVTGDRPAMLAEAMRVPVEGVE